MPLRKNKSGSQLPWSEEQILAGLRLYYETHNRYPTAHEIDAFEYLPSSRSIQRNYGGLVNLRKRLIPDGISDHTAGDYRREKAREADKRAKAYEEEFYNALLNSFLAIAVHEHKVIRPGNVNSDFFIYTSEIDGVVIDLFYAQDMLSLINVVNIKLKRYVGLPYEIYFVAVGNPGLTDDLIASRMANRKIPLPRNIQVISETGFKNVIIPKIKQQSKFSLP